MRSKILCALFLIGSFVAYGQTLVEEDVPQVSTTISKTVTQTTTTSTSSTTTSIQTTTTTIPPTTTTSSTASTSPAVLISEPSDVWDRLAICETHSNPPNWGSRGGAYEGGLQFKPYIWKSYVADGKPYGLQGYPEHAYDATREQQITVAIRVRDGIKESRDPYLNAQGWGAWPTCRHEAGV